VESDEVYIDIYSGHKQEALLFCLLAITTEDG